MLILANDGGKEDLYTRLQEIKRQYVHRFPQVEAYFYKADPMLSSDYEIRGDVIWVKTSETYPRLWKKLWMTLRAFEHRFHEFDYICRPNLSTFIVMERYLTYLETLPRKQCCSGIIYYNGQPIPFPAGYFFTISPDVASLIIHTPIIPNNEGIDDRCIGVILERYMIPIIPMKYLHISDAENEYHTMINRIVEEDLFIIRIRHFSQSYLYQFGIDSPNRLQDDLYIHYTLLTNFYPNSSLTPLCTSFATPF